MKKIFGFAASLILVIVSANAQTVKKEPPPPPPPIPMTETVKFDPPKIVKEPPVVTIRGKMAEEFYKRNPSVTEISRQGGIISIKKKDGTTEKYDMNKKEEDKNFTEKYGVSPIPPPPPPPKPKSKA